MDGEVTSNGRHSSKEEEELSLSPPYSCAICCCGKSKLAQFNPQQISISRSIRVLFLNPRALLVARCLGRRKAWPITMFCNSSYAILEPEAA